MICCNIRFSCFITHGLFRNRHDIFKIIWNQDVLDSLLVFLLILMVVGRIFKLNYDTVDGLHEYP
jgi:hypothetical protein